MLENYDVIDLDAYGVPYQQLSIVLEYFRKAKSNKEHVVFVTFIQTLFGGLPRKLLYEIGYTKGMVEKVPSLFNVGGFEKIKRYLYKYGVRKIWSINIDRKHYFCFKIKTC